ncbi:MAG: aqualysin [Mongoliibacter sp.]|uniref:S8 family serine peptidase n=1 Tax=Mongoliibacter sp. TaxID=2022438 RepID=UPI0012F38195|nr:S8 family serine peptidase [Mongoliibacter sp.]TVP43538.1 MAG: aqualysin [Mongoliibacter sp.]
MSVFKQIQIQKTLPFCVMLVLFIVFSCQELNLEEPKPEDLSKLDQSMSNVVPGRYIVTLHSDEINFRKSDKYEDVQLEMRKISHDILIKYSIDSDKIKAVYGNAFEGFSVQLEPFEFQLIKQDPVVEFVIPDQYVVGHSILKKGGNSGKGGGGNPEPEPDPEPELGIQPQWYLDRLDQRLLPLDGKFSTPTTGNGVTAYMIGAPILENLNEFNGRAINIDLTGDVPNEPLLLDWGVLNAAALGGENYGVAKGVKIVSLDVWDGESTVSSYLRAMDWILANGQKPGLVFLPLMGQTDIELVEFTINQLFHEGFPIFTHTFFGGNTCNQVPTKFDNVFSVGSTNFVDGLAWDSYGSCINLFAPGVSVLRGGFPEYQTNELFDLSYENAACLAAGVAALYLETNPTASAQQVYDFLFETSTKNVVRFSKSINNHLLYSGLTPLGAGEIDPNRPNYAFDLEAKSQRRNGNNYTIFFEWSQIESETNRLNVFEDGEGIGSVVADQGLWISDVTGRNLPPRTYKFCVPRTNLCSNEVTVTF